MPELDLDQKRDERKAAEAEREPKAVVFGGATFPLPADIPVEALEELENGRIVAFVRGLLGDRFDEFVALGATRADLHAFADGFAELYGTTEGESAASSGS